MNSRSIVQESTWRLALRLAFTQQNLDTTISTSITCGEDGRDGCDRSRPPISGFDSTFRKFGLEYYHYPPKGSPILPPLVGPERQLQLLFSWADLEFAAGLDKVLHSPTPPPISFFQSFPADCPTNTWGVYCLISEKRGAHPRLYVGSGTAYINSGLKSCLRSHMLASRTPSKVKEAKKESYHLTHLTIWASCPFPSDENKAFGDLTPLFFTNPSQSFHPFSPQQR